MDDPQGELGQYLALLPSWVGHELTDQDLVVAAFDRNGQTIAHAAVSWNPELPRHNVAHDLAYHLASSLERQDEIARMLVIEYGPAGRDRAAWLVNALHGHSPATPGQIHVHDDTWRTQALTADGCGPAHPLPQDVLATDLPELTVTARALDQTLNPADQSGTVDTDAGLATAQPARHRPRAHRDEHGTAAGCGASTRLPARRDRSHRLFGGSPRLDLHRPGPSHRAVPDHATRRRARPRPRRPTRAHGRRGIPSYRHNILAGVSTPHCPDGIPTPTTRQGSNKASGQDAPGRPPERKQPSSAPAFDLEL